MGEQNVTDYTFLPPTPENLAKLRPVIPAGYTQVSGNSADLFGQKPTTCSAELAAPRQSSAQWPDRSGGPVTGRERARACGQLMSNSLPSGSFIPTA